VNLLGLDTSTAASAACVLRADGRAFEVVPPPSGLPAAPGHARELMPAVDRALADAGLGFDDLDAVAVGVGPGGFTGLRIGVATARAIASARALPLHPVSSLAALAAEITPGPALAVLDARRGEVFAALHVEGRELWPAFVATPAALAERLRAEGMVPRAVGDGAVRFRSELEAAGASVPAGDSPSHVVRALHVCRLGAGTPPAAPEAVLPNYLRMSDAVPTPQSAAP
jgi:tRNA threonylcarbamoyladenosine biosynthesis protein TsaB